MLRTWKRVDLNLKRLSGALAVTALTLLAAACETGGPTQPALEPAVEQGVVYSNSGQRFVVVKESDANIGVVTAVIGSSGGKLMLGKHELNVPKDAVRGPTTFTMTKLDGEYLRVRLTATELLLNDVGSKGFNVPLRLSLSYENAAELPDNLEELVVAWIRPDGVAELKASTVEVQGHRVRSDLDHFSEYALIWP
jgi:hypothetical protein